MPLMFFLGCDADDLSLVYLWYDNVSSTPEEWLERVLL